MDGRPVVVLTSSQRAVSVGTLRLSEASPADATPRIDLHFETESMRCIMRIPMDRVEDILASWNGDMYRYVLPSGEQVWLPPEPPPFKPSEPTEAIIEVYPLPPQAVRPPLSTPNLINPTPTPNRPIRRKVG